MYAETIFQFKKMLINLEGWMTKASAHADAKKFDVNNYVHMRLAPDMYAFNKQIQSTCDSAKFCAAYLSGQTAPKHEDNEVTWDQLRERVRKVVTYLETFKPEHFAKAATVKVSPRWAEGKWVTGQEYLNEIAIPNFYFHAMVIYSILRHAGVDVGKTDYMGHLNFKN